MSIRFQELLVDISQFSRRTNPRANSVKGAPGFNPDNAVASGVKFLAKAMIFVQEWGDSRTKSAFLESEGFVGRLAPLLQNGEGAVVEVQSDQWRSPDAVGNQPKLFRTAVICGSGKSPQEVLFRYFNSDRLSAAPPEGWKRINTYLWATFVI